MSRSNKLLLLIIAFFLFTRFYKISEIPVSVYWDEASIGYNAYSIVETGKDEWGKFLPIHFRAFGEFKLPVYIYSVAIFVKIFGLNEFSVRFPAVLFSLGVVILTFLLARKLTGETKVGLWSSFFLTISPWFFIFSRTGYEVTAGEMFYLLGIYLFLSIKKNNWYILLSILSFILSAYSYNSFRIITPLTILILFLSGIKNVKSVLPILISIILICFSIIPIYRLYTLDSGTSRFQAVGIENKWSFFKNYASHFSLEFLLQGDKNLRSQQKDFGQIYFPELILFILGLIYIYRKSKSNILLLFLLLLGPIPAAITKESPHALRSLSMVPFMAIISAMGIGQVRKNIIAFVVVLVFLGFFVNYFINFLNVYPAESAKDWQYDYKKIFTNPAFQSGTRNKILISDREGQPYIFALFYLKYDPEKFQKEVFRNSVDKWGFSTVKSFGKYEFTN